MSPDRAWAAASKAPRASAGIFRSQCMMITMIIAMIDNDSPDLISQGLYYATSYYELPTEPLPRGRRDGGESGNPTLSAAQHKVAIAVITQ